jgi:hypothetical protein
MIRKIGRRSHAAARYLVRRPLYIVGVAAWVVTGILAASFTWPNPTDSVMAGSKLADGKPSTATATHCTNDPLPGFEVQGNRTVSVAVGGQSTAEALTTSDGRTVTWRADSPILWGDFTIKEPKAPVRFAVAYLPGTLAGEKLEYVVQALPWAQPGTYQLTWKVKTGTAPKTCRHLAITVTVEPAKPVAAPL